MKLVDLNYYECYDLIIKNGIFSNMSNDRVITEAFFKEIGKTQEQLGEEVGVSQSAVSQWKLRQRIPRGVLLYFRKAYPKLHCWSLSDVPLNQKRRRK